MSVHGTFWDEPIRTDDELRDIPQRGLYTVRVELEGARWADELNLPEVRRKVLRGLLVSHTAGIEDGFEAQWVGAVEKGEVLLTRESPSSIQVTVPVLAGYRLAKGARETIGMGVVPKEATTCSQALLPPTPTAL